MKSYNEFIALRSVCLWSVCCGQLTWLVIFCGLASHFQLKKTLFMMMILAAKIEFLQLRGDAHLKTDLTREDIGRFWADTDI